ncbi:hypothetical protein JHK86_050907 [Glycine max]|nr:hypothetical protein JHK86_050907 [Glycine max]
MPPYVVPPPLRAMPPHAAPPQPHQCHLESLTLQAPTITPPCIFFSLHSLVQSLSSPPFVSTFRPADWDSIPPEFGKLEHLQSLDRSKNFLGGTIPSMLGGLKRLERLNSSHNNLSDNLSSFGDMLSLIFVDVSYNQLKSSLPNIPAFRIGTIETLRNNQDLCGNVSGLEPCPKASKKSQNHKTNKVILVFLPVGLGTLILALFAFGVSYRLCRSSKTKEHQDAKPPGQNLFVIWSFDGKMVYENIVETT